MCKGHEACPRDKYHASTTPISSPGPILLIRDTLFQNGQNSLSSSSIAISRFNMICIPNWEYETLWATSKSFPDGIFLLSFVRNILFQQFVECCCFRNFCTQIYLEKGQFFDEKWFERKSVKKSEETIWKDLGDTASMCLPQICSEHTKAMVEDRFRHS